MYSEALYPNYSFKNSPDGLEGYQAERMGCVTNSKEQGHVPEVTVRICSVIIALKMKDLSQIIGKFLTKEFLTLGQHQTKDRELDKEN